MQLQTTAWPNYGVPEETGGVCELLHLCRAAREVSCTYPYPKPNPEPSNPEPEPIH